jgi:hypothetical protein
MRCVLLGLLLCSCYAGQRASNDINRAWQGRQVGELQATWGTPASTQVSNGGTVQIWSITNHHFSLPKLKGRLDVGPGGVDLYAEARPGQRWQSKTQVKVSVDASGVIAAMHGPSIRWGRPEGANLRSGLVMGLRASMGRLDDTKTSLPGTGAYIGGMLGPRLALVGNYSFASGKDTEGGAIGMAWSLTPMYWLSSRVSVRGGPAAILAFDPGFKDIGAEGGLDGTLSYALVRSGSFVLDLRIDATAGPDTQFASVGIGVNVN